MPIAGPPPAGAPPVDAEPTRRDGRDIAGRNTVDPDIVGRVDEALANFLDEMRGHLSAAGPELEIVATAARDLVFAGGKRIRPLFAYWGWRCVCDTGTGDTGTGDTGTGDTGPSEAATAEAAMVQAAAALELLHAAALVHDDLIDQSATRRGQPAAHTRMSRLHVDSSWPGSAPDFGAAAAILIGDLLLSWSAAMFAGAALPADRAVEARHVFEVMATEMMAGQYLDVLAQARGLHSVDLALRVARYKSSKYTVERPLHLGAAAAGASAEVRRSLSDFGLPVGEAFQLRDDVLGVFGDPRRTGKPAGDDLREGKRTVLVALAQQAARPAQRDVLERTLGRADLDEDGVARLREIIVGTGALAAVEALIAERADRGRAALDAADIRPDARTALAGLAAAAIDRHS